MKPQIGLGHLRSVTFSSALDAFGTKYLCGAKAGESASEKGLCRKVQLEILETLEILESPQSVEKILETVTRR